MALAAVVEAVYGHDIEVRVLKGQQRRRRMGLGPLKGCHRVRRGRGGGGGKDKKNAKGRKREKW